MTPAPPTGAQSRSIGRFAHDHGPAHRPDDHSQRGVISREIFVSPDAYREEQEKLFARAWLFIGHESLIPKPGDFFVSRMGEELVILCRDQAARCTCS